MDEVRDHQVQISISPRYCDVCYWLRTRERGEASVSAFTISYSVLDDAQELGMDRERSSIWWLDLAQMFVTNCTLRSHCRKPYLWFRSILDKTNNKPGESGDIWRGDMQIQPSETLRIEHLTTTQLHAT